MSSDLYNQIMNQRGSLDRLLAKLPGYEGYRDLQARRDADRTLREHLARQVDERIKRLAQIERRLLDGGGLKYMALTQSAKTKLQTYHDRLMAGTQGYGGFFDRVSLDAEALDLLHGFDELQVVHLDRLNEAVSALGAAVDSGEGIEEAIEALDVQAREANEAFSRREGTLHNLGIAE